MFEIESKTPTEIAIITKTTTIKFDVEDEMRKNIRKYFNYDLSEQDIYNMCNGLDHNGENMIR